MLSSGKRGEMLQGWNEIEVLLFEVEEGIEECPSLIKSAGRKGSPER
jgi:hypothetical protein